MIDIIEEENSENCSDLEFSLKKKSMIFSSKLKASNSDKKESIVNVNLSSSPVNVANNFMKNEGKYSKSEVPCSYTGKKTSYNEVKDILDSNHKISKSEMFNLKVDIKKILVEMEKRKKIEEENSKIKVLGRKKQILDSFIKCKFFNLC